MADCGITAASSGSSDDDHRTTPAAGSTPTPAAPYAAAGATPSSSAKKPRGRPRGSKNKPKPPMVITQRDESAMHVVVLEIRAGSDIIEAVSDFTRRRGVGASVIAGSGAVTNVIVRHPQAAAVNTYSLHGRFDIVTLSGTILPSSSASPFSVTVAGPQGAVYGGAVVGALTAAEGVVVVVGTFGSSEFYRLEGGRDGVDEEEGAGGSGGSGRNRGVLLEEAKPSIAAGYGGGGTSTSLVHMAADVGLPWSVGVARSGPPAAYHHHNHTHHF